MKAYIERICQKEIELKLESSGAIHIVGPKWCGKTTLAKQYSNSFVELQDPDKKDKYLETFKIKPSLILEGEKPRLIDEWQEIPKIWDVVRSSVDKEDEFGLYLLTGSNTVDQNQIMHSGTGRIAEMMMYPMSLYESSESNGKVSLNQLFENKDLSEEIISSHIGLEEIIFAACRGGWPNTLKIKNKEAALEVANNYVDSLVNVEISKVDNISRNPKIVRDILRSYSRNLSTLSNNKTIMDDVRANNLISDTTFYDYVNVLKKLYIINDIDAWNPSIRSKTAIRSSVKRSLVDPSIAVASLGVKPDYFKTDLKTFGFIFESLCIRDLLVYSSKMGGKISYYRDRYGLEVDAVLHLRNNQYALIEFKLGTNELDLAAKHLLKVEELIEKKNLESNSTKINKPDLKIIVTATEYAYKRDDGVFVIPISCLRD